MAVTRVLCTVTRLFCKWLTDKEESAILLCGPWRRLRSGPLANLLPVYWWLDLSGPTCNSGLVPLRYSDLGPSAFNWLDLENKLILCKVITYFYWSSTPVKVNGTNLSNKQSGPCLKLGSGPLACERYAEARVSRAFSLASCRSYDSLRKKVTPLRHPNFDVTPVSTENEKLPFDVRNTFSTWRRFWWPVHFAVRWQLRNQRLPWRGHWKER